ncbi:MAG: AEC family transporter [Bacillota bacterium]
MPIDAVLPAFLIAALGYVLGNRLGLEKQTLSRVCLHVLVPALAFNSLVTSTVDLAVAWRLVLAAMTFPLVEIALFLPLFKLLKWDQNRSRAMLLATIFTNAGNYGLPVMLFAFGQEGMDFGVVFMVAQTIMIYTLGVYIAASSQMTASKALRQVLKMPAVWAALAGITVRLTGVPIPEVLMRPVGLLAQAAVPVFLLLLGLQLLGSSAGQESWKTPSIGVILRLVIAPVIAMLLGRAFGLSGLPWKILVLQAAMSTPVNATVLAQEFSAEPATVTRVTAASTVASVLTLTLWIMALRAL